MSYNQFARSNSTHEEWKLVDKFDSAYWSGLDVQIYADSICLNEAIQVSYAISEQIRPYYGYASYIPDRIYHGSRIIQGEISMNFKRDGYLFSLLSFLRLQNGNNINLPGQGITGGGASPEKRVPVDYSNMAWGPDGSTLSQQIKNNKITPEALAKLVRDNVTNSSEAVLNTNKFSPNIQERSGLFETRQEGFDINIIFGSTLNAAQTLRFSDGSTYEVGASDSLYNYGVVDQGKYSIPANTGIKLIGCSIAGLARSINDDGRPIIETYSFQARDIVILHNTAPVVSRTDASSFTGTTAGMANNGTDPSLRNQATPSYQTENSQGQYGNYDLPGINPYGGDNA